MSRAWWVALAAAAAGAHASCGDGAAERVEPPNVLLVSLDTVRADHLSCYGYARKTSPRIDALAQEGVLFERAWSSSSWTLPAHLTMLTGQPTSVHGVCDDRLWTRVGASGEPSEVPLRGTFVSEVLAREGYATGGFYTWKYLEPQFGFGAGFETWERLGHSFWSHPLVGPEFERLREANDVEGMKALAARHPELFDDTRPSTPETVDRATEWLDAWQAGDGGEGRPFFLFVHLFDAHDPYVPPEPYASLFDPDYEGPIDGRRVTAPDSPVHGDMAPEDLAHLVALYDGEIAAVDHGVGRLLDALAERGLERDTLVVVTSDHGEEFFDHGHKGHRRQVYVESVRVPLVLRWPGRLPAGTRVAAGAGLVDLAPTIAGAAGTRMPEATGGIDLVALARAGPGTKARTLTAELLLFDGSPVPERHLALAAGDSFVVLRARGDAPWQARGFDLEADPNGAGEGSPFAPEEREELLQGLDLVRDACERLRAGLPERGRSLPALDEHDLGQLAAMGYAGVGEAPRSAEDDAGRLCFDGCVWPDE